VSDDGAAWYQEWAQFYCDQTGANPVMRNVVVGAKFSLVTQLGATVEELGAVLTRFITGARVPQFPTQVTNAIVSELRELREERARLGRPDASEDAWQPARGPTCLVCGDTGLVTVPHRLCIRDRRISLGRRTAFRFLTGSVLCDRPGCGPGRRARDDEQRRECGRRGPRPTLGDYSRELNCDPVALLAEHEAAQADRARGGPRGPQDETWAALVARVRRRSAGERTEGEAA
jgi:hypothetical protein